jgi:UDP-4-amino-4,6-dideoxy-N-acetyl-beta-L-altrosamine N-acetyltransferase
MPRTYNLVPLIDLDKEIQLQVLKIRNEDHIKEWMFTQMEIKEEEHLSWIERLKKDETQKSFVIVNENSKPLGNINLKKIDKVNKNAELGFYKSQNSKEKGLMYKSLSTIINYSFDIIGLEKIYTEVFYFFTKSINLHKRLLFVEEGYLRSHIIIRGHRIGVHLYGLLKEEWKTNKNETLIPEGIEVSIN